MYCIFCVSYMKHIKVVMLLMKNVSHPTIIKAESQK